MHDTLFAPAARATAEELAQDIARAASSPIIDALLDTSGALLAVLNEARQVLAVNAGLLKYLGVDDGHPALGLRPGEVLGCVHAQEPPSGCGTTRFCSTCGAVVAIVTALKSDHPSERSCILRAQRQGVEVDVCLCVRAAPLVLEGRRFVVLFIRDDTRAHRQAVIEQLFFHDLNNLLFGLQMAADAEDDAAVIKQLVSQVVLQVKLHRAMVLGDASGYEPQPAPLEVAKVLSDLSALAARHPAAQGRHLEIAGPREPTSLVTDRALLHRVLVNMLLNAFEATPRGGQVRVWVETSNAGLTFRVANPGLIPSGVAVRIFQRNFSTKSDNSRGLGTHAMKLFGEELLGGKVTFTTAERTGTVFSLALPREWRRGQRS